MTDQNSHLSERAKKAEKIIARPQGYKVCEGCDSIVTERVATCPNCNGYRFDESPDAVIAQAKILATREQTSVAAQDLL
ncbi:MAG: hypothetical protein WCH43_15305 [Verrucomicrobiota bacterium]